MIRALIFGVALLGSLEPAAAQSSPGSTPSAAPPNRAQLCEAVDLSALRAAVASDAADVDDVQEGLRSALDRYVGQLEDGLVGPVTAAALNDLCLVVPVAGGTDPMQDTLDLARRYARVDRIKDGWLDAAAAILPPSAGSSAFNRRFALLAGPAPVAAIGLDNAVSPGTGACPVAASAVAALSSAKATEVLRGFSALFAADPRLTLSQGFSNIDIAAPVASQEICAVYGLNIRGETILDFSARLGRLESLYSGAVDVLGEAGFARWVLERTPERPRRLLGTEPAAAALLTEYSALQPLPACEEGPYDNVAMLKNDLATLQAREGLAKALEGITDTFDTSEDLAAEVVETLGVEAGGCVATQILDVVEAPASRGATFAFNPEALGELKLNSDLRGLAATMQSLSEAPVPDEAKWTSAMTEAVRQGVTQIVTQQIQTAVGIVSADATEIDATPVSPPVSFETPTTGGAAAGASGAAAAPPKGFAVTGNTLLLIGPKIDDPDLLAAIAELPLTVYPSRDALKTNVELALQDFAGSRREALERDAAELLGLPASGAGTSGSGASGGSAAAGGSAGGATTANASTARASSSAEPGASPPLGSGVLRAWKMSAEMSRALARDVPALAPLVPSTLTALGEIQGIQYPTTRLFEAAMQSAPPKLDLAALEKQDASAGTGDQLGSILEVAQKVADVSSVRTALEARDQDASVDVDCGCAIQWSETTTLYAFYPYWDLEGARSGDGARPLVDFETINRVAFHGLVLGPDRTISPAAAALWSAAGPSFVLSAHQHKARADLSIRLRGWRDWVDAAGGGPASGQSAGGSSSAGAGSSANAVADAAVQISSRIVDLLTLQQPEGLPGSSEDGLLRRVITWFDLRYLSAQPDGVTLLIEDYDAVSPPDAAVEALSQVIATLAETLADRGMTLNLALDVPLDGPADDGTIVLTTPFLAGLHDLLLPSTSSAAAAAGAGGGGLLPTVLRTMTDYLDGPEKAAIDRILVFIQRPTADAKKRLRQLVESSFQGDDRATVMRKVVPIVPSASHQNVVRANVPGVTTEPDVLQFADDVVYFEDNFGGMGFWPTPSASAETGMALMDDVLRGFAERRDSVLPSELRKFIEDRSTGVARPSDLCDLICTNRSIATSANGALLALAVAIVVLSYFFWRMDQLKRDTPAIPVLIIALLVSLGALAVCANGGEDWARFVIAFVAVMLVLAYRQVTRWRRGLLP